jgi:hypothetical protein
MYCLHSKLLATIATFERLLAKPNELREGELSFEQGELLRSAAERP